MPKRQKPPELTFQQHIADFLDRVHRYGVLEQADITDTEHCIAEDQLWAFLNATQADQLQKLTDDYGTDAREEVFRALRKELEYAPLWMILRHGLKVRGLEFRLFYPLLKEIPWDHRLCPVCGGSADFAALEGGVGERRLLCLLCDTEWQYQRVGCPSCGNQDS